MPELTPNPFDYVRPDSESIGRIDMLTYLVKKLYDELLMVPDSRERSLAITKLQEARMWWNAAIVFDQARTRGRAE